MLDFKLDKTEICSCGRLHNEDVCDCVLKKNAISEIPVYMEKFGVIKAFIVSDLNKY